MYRILFLALFSTCSTTSSAQDAGVDSRTLPVLEEPNLKFLTELDLSLSLMRIQEFSDTSCSSNQFIDLDITNLQDKPKALFFDCKSLVVRSNTYTLNCTHKTVGFPIIYRYLDMSLYRGWGRQLDGNVTFTVWAEELGYCIAYYDVIDALEIWE